MSTLIRALAPLALGLLLTGPALAQTVECLVDLDAGSFQWHFADPAGPTGVLVPDAALQLARIDSLLAAGDEATELRDALGAAILGPVHDQLAGFDELRFVPVQTEPVPGRLAAINLMNFPSGHPVLASHAVSLGWPRPLRVPEAREIPDTGALLMSAPFSAGIAPALDDPDTLRRALTLAAKSVLLVPRNEPEASTLRRALEEEAPALWWFRASSGQLAGLQPAFGALPPIVVWTLPSHDEAGPPALSPATFASGGTGPACVIVSTRVLGETVLAGLARRLVDLLATGVPAGRALHEAQLEGLANGGAAADMGALILIGASQARSGLARASWLRRIRG